MQVSRLQAAGVRASAKLALAARWAAKMAAGYHTQQGNPLRQRMWRTGSKISL